MRPAPTTNIWDNSQPISPGSPVKRLYPGAVLRGGEDGFSLEAGDGDRKGQGCEGGRVPPGVPAAHPEKRGRVERLSGGDAGMCVCEGTQE